METTMVVDWITDVSSKLVMIRNFSTHITLQIDGLNVDQENE